MRVAAGGRGVEVGRAPDAAVDVLPALDLNRRKQPRARCMTPAPPAATDTSGARGLPNTTRRPLRRSTAVTRRRPSKRAPERSIRLRRSAEVLAGSGDSPQHRRAHHGSARRGHPERERGERRSGRHRKRAGALGGVQSRPTPARRRTRSPPPRRTSRCRCWTDGAATDPRPGARTRSRPRTFRRRPRIRAGRSRWRPRSRRARPSSMPRRGRPRLRAPRRPEG